MGPKHTIRIQDFVKEKILRNMHSFLLESLCPQKKEYVIGVYETEGSSSNRKGCTNKKRLNLSKKLNIE